MKRQKTQTKMQQKTQRRQQQQAIAEEGGRTFDTVQARECVGTTTIEPVARLAKE